jgi:hypothetical protein
MQFRKVLMKKHFQLPKSYVSLLLNFRQVLGEGARLWLDIAELLERILD